jgi:hypothetical protein
MSLRSAAAAALNNVKSYPKEAVDAIKSGAAAHVAQRSYGNDLIKKLPASSIMGATNFNKAAKIIREKIQSSPRDAAVYTTSQLMKANDQAGGKNDTIKTKLNTMKAYRSIAAKLINNK